ncbi:MAG: ribosome recycling factor [Bacteroidia bacterium]|nr:ribosome recycling factor [Bacteroidia bacterium]MCX7652566.1 ribosome recycling factor [Bacteroidia bacterium]MDW8417558.1 ribosome recycling factor [Bacteroidia bacterium]
MAPEIQTLLSHAEEHMKKSLAHYDELFGKIRAGKATPALIEHLKVDYYGTPTPIKHVATFSVQDTRTLLLQPFEPQMAKPIEKAIAEANLGLSVATEGKAVRVTFPSLTEEQRKRFVKQVKDLAEEGRVAIRNIRRDILEEMRKLTKNGVPEDMVRKGQDDLQKLTDKYISRIDQLSEAKEQELLTV